MRRVLAFLVTLFLTFISGVHAQSTNASLTGRITDPTKATIAGAKVSIVNESTGISQGSVTDKDGNYYEPNLAPGTYRVEIEKLGFKTVVKSNIVLHVQDIVEVNFEMAVGSASEVVTVEGGAPLVDTQSATVGTLVDRQFVGNMPLNGRSFQSLILLAPGTVTVLGSDSDNGQFSVNGQRGDANYFTVDGVSANAGLIPFNGRIGSGGAGSGPATTAQGGYNNLVSVDDLQEFNIQTSTFAPEFGRLPGGQVSILTRSGTEKFHGDVFDYFRNEKLDANNWFNNSKGFPKTPLRQNDFGGVVGGPVLKSKLFFFFSYEGLRLLQPSTFNTFVPSIAARQTGGSLQPLLKAFPLPNGGLTSDPNFNFYTASSSSPTALDNTSIRVDYVLTKRMTLFGRYNRAPSYRKKQFVWLETDPVNFEALTLGDTFSVAPSVSNELRFNNSRSTSGSSFAIDAFGGATPLSGPGLFPPGVNGSSGLFIIFVFGASGTFRTQTFTGINTANTQQQWNIVDNLSYHRGSHQWKFGFDYRRLTPILNPGTYNQLVQMVDPAKWQNGIADSIITNSFKPQQWSFTNVSFFAQDTWRVKPRLTLTYGLRWDVNPAPGSPNGTPAVAINDQLLNPSALALRPLGSPLYATTYNNFGPRVGVAYQLSTDPRWGRVIRGGVGVFYDTAGSAGAAAQGGPYVGQNTFNNIAYPLSDANLAAPPLSTSPPFSQVRTTDPHLKLPRTYQFSLGMEQVLGQNQSFSAIYVGAIGRRLLRFEEFFNAVSFTPLLQVSTNSATSNYNALQLQYKRRISHGLQALASYTWAHSIDDTSISVTSDTFGTVNSNNPGFESTNRGPSDFDIRNTFSTAISYDLPTPKSHKFLSAVLGHWGTDLIYHFNTALPVEIQEQGVNVAQTQQAIYVRPDRVSGQPLYVYGSACAKVFNALFGGGSCPGGKGINPNAFSLAGIVDSNGNLLRQGNLGRNALRAFPTQQLDLAIRRDFPIAERFHLEFRGDFFNIVNHPNFAPPDNNLTDPTFGTATSMLNTFSNFSPLYSIGGPRSIQLSLKFRF